MSYKSLIERLIIKGSVKPYYAKMQSSQAYILDYDKSKSDNLDISDTTIKSLGVTGWAKELEAAFDKEDIKYNKVLIGGNLAPIVFIDNE